MCCILYTNVITLPVIIKTIPPKCRPLESCLPHYYSWNYNLQGDEHAYHNIEDEFINDPMDEDDVIDTNVEDEINRLIQDTFAPLDEDNLHDIHDVTLLKKSQEPLYDGSTKNILSSILLLVNLKVLNGFPKSCFT